MSDLSFRVQGSKAYVIRNGNEKEIPRDSLLEIYQLVLGHIAPARDYSSVTSVRKLLRVIDLECEPDESDDESDEAVEEVKPPSPKKAPAKPPARGGRKPAARTVRKTPVKQAPAESDNDSDEDSDDE